MSPVAAVIAVAVIAVALIVMLGWVQTVRTRRATRAGLERATGHVTDAQLLGLVTHAAPDERVRSAPADVPPHEVQAAVDRLRPEGDTRT